LRTGLALGAYRDSELGLAAALWPQLPDASPVILDREFAAYALYHQLGDPTRQRHWLTRARTGPLALRRRVVTRLGPGDALVELTPSQEARRLVRHGARDLPPTLRVRAIRYRRRGFRPRTLLTSLLDPDAYPAAEIVALYHERWELELGFDEVKTPPSSAPRLCGARRPRASRRKCGGSRSATTSCASPWPAWLRAPAWRP